MLSLFWLIICLPMLNFVQVYHTIWYTTFASFPPSFCYSGLFKVFNIMGIPQSHTPPPTNTQNFLILCRVRLNIRYQHQNLHRSAPFWNTVPRVSWLWEINHVTALSVMAILSFILWKPTLYKRYKLILQHRQGKQMFPNSHWLKLKGGRGYQSWIGWNRPFDQSIHRGHYACAATYVIVWWRTLSAATYVRVWWKTSSLTLNRASGREYCLTVTCFLLRL